MRNGTRSLRRMSVRCREYAWPGRQVRRDILFHGILKHRSRNRKVVLLVRANGSGLAMATRIVEVEFGLGKGAMLCFALPGAEPSFSSPTALEMSRVEEVDKSACLYPISQTGSIIFARVLGNHNGIHHA